MVENAALADGLGLVGVACPSADLLARLRLLQVRQVRPSQVERVGDHRHLARGGRQARALVYRVIAVILGRFLVVIVVILGGDQIVGYLQKNQW